MKILIFALVISFMLGFGLVTQAQNAIPASGGNASGSGGTANYTIGQLVYNTITGTNGSAVQGVQQPYEISVVTGIEKAIDISLEIVAFPNPATDYVKLKVENHETVNLHYQLYNINATPLENKKIESNETIIVLRDLIQGIYFLKVTDKQKEIKTFKIIKN